MIRVTLFGESNLPILSYDMLLDGCRSERMVVELASPTVIMKIVVDMDGRMDDDPDPRPIDVDEALTVLTDFVHEHTRDEEPPDSGREPDSEIDSFVREPDSDL